VHCSIHAVPGGLAMASATGPNRLAGFTRLGHARDIHAPDGTGCQRDGNHPVIAATCILSPLQAPGSIAQAVALYDPVGTGVPVNDSERRLPPTVRSGFQLIAEDERRGTLKAAHSMDPRMTAGGPLRIRLRACACRRQRRVDAQRALLSGACCLR